MNYYDLTGFFEKKKKNLLFFIRIEWCGCGQVAQSAWPLTVDNAINIKRVISILCYNDGLLISQSNRYTYHQLDNIFLSFLDKNAIKTSVLG